MHFEKLLETYVLDHNIFNLMDENCRNNKKSNQPTFNSPTSAEPETKLNHNCFNCFHLKTASSKDEFDTCSLKKDRVEDYYADNSCTSFQRQKCKDDCGFYQDGACYFHDADKKKNPDDECDYNAESFE